MPFTFDYEQFSSGGFQLQPTRYLVTWCKHPVVLPSQCAVWKFHETLGKKRAAFYISGPIMVQRMTWCCIPKKCFPPISRGWKEQGLLTNLWGWQVPWFFSMAIHNWCPQPKFPSSSMSRPTSLPVTPPSSPSASCREILQNYDCFINFQVWSGEVVEPVELFGSWGQTVSHLDFSVSNVGIHFFRIGKKMGSHW